jgi:hypothetical protein
MILSPQDVLYEGLRFCKCVYKAAWTKARTDDFKAHYGSSPVVLAHQWEDLVISELTEADKSMRGFRSFLIAHHFLWAYPKNAKLLARVFGVCEREVQGHNLWRWVTMIAALKANKIVWPEAEFNDPAGHIFIISVDGTDFRVWEKKHPTFTIDRQQCSHKFKHGALKYEIAIDIYRAKIVWISGPYPGSVHDKTIYIEGGLCDKIPAGKKVITDRVYGNKASPDDHIKLALPNHQDSKELNNFKARVKSRHETLNGRLKFFSILEKTFTHDAANHVHAFEAVCVTVQYQMDLGGEIYAV